MADHITGPIAYSYWRIMEPYTPTKTSTINGWQLISEQYQLVRQMVGCGSILYRPTLTVDYTY